MHNLRADGTFAYRVGKVFGNLVIYVRFQQGKTYLAHCFLYVGLIQFSF